ncbi:hypothetical protein [Planomonospora venezuelensis]|uniref:Secreted protein n=1 Tax=Planomonospora venezuelensis TaxID=1999 RepID=A0A841D9P5_PLAVE|nr:hypothetical protein [Planomonospora venezuelensis]MBB5966911.1 hypothetical protein [Planomonospora venezuelensis]GIN02412.1 hypothetical protein Pve01_40700 [Planomonospora venezuelensis]
MKRLGNLAAAVLLAAAASILAAAPAWAATTTIHRDNAAGAAYAGKVRATLIAPVSVSTSLGTATCNTGNIDAAIQSDGTALNVSGFSFSNSPGPACPNSAGGQSTVSAVGLPWNGGNVTYGAVSGGRDATLTLTNVRVSSVTTGWFGTITCVYRGSGASDSIVLDGFNADNAARPDPSVDQAQARAVNSGLSKVSGSFLCPGTARYSATFQLLGETVAGSGVYDQKLHITS